MQKPINPWMAFFDGFAPEYEKECFTQNTLKEVDFLLDVMALSPGMRVLDMGCGTGRHSVEFARRGFRVTGVDLSAGMLAQAARNAEAAGVTVEWVQEDATLFSSAPDFDAAVCLCEGAFGLLGPGDGPNTQPLAILQAVHGALRPGAAFALTCLNAMRLIRAATPEDVAGGKFDPATLTEVSSMECETPEGKRSVTLRERVFVPTEAESLCRSAGFDVEQIWGGTAGRWGRRPVELDEMEIMVVARKAGAWRA